jgi:hypothetical protein
MADAMGTLADETTGMGLALDLALDGFPLNAGRCLVLCHG